MFCTYLFRTAAGDLRYRVDYMACKHHVCFPVACQIHIFTGAMHNSAQSAHIKIQIRAPLGQRVPVQCFGQQIWRVCLHSWSHECALSILIIIYMPNGVRTTKWAFRSRVSPKSRCRFIPSELQNCVGILQSGRFA